MSEGVKRQCQVQRFRCTQCKKTFTLLPPFLLPFKRYVVSEIEAVLRHFLDGKTLSEAPCQASESTLWRWCKEFGCKMVEWAGMMEAQFIRLGKPVPGLMQSLSNPLKRLEQKLSCLPALPLQWTVITKTLWWLKNSHPL